MAAVLNSLASNLASGASGVVIDGVNAGTSSLPFADFFSGDKTSSSAPEAYLNYFVFDQNYDLISSQSGFKQVGTSARETGSDVDHQKLSHSITIAKAGYVYIYLSNDDTDPFDVFFDDFKVTQHHTDIVSKDDYYPFGLTFNSYSRPTSTAQNFKYNGFEYQEDLGLNLYDYLARQYDPVLGRFTSVDPAADLMRRHSPYNYAFDNPIRYIDPDGMLPEDKTDQEQETQQDEEEVEEEKPKEEERNSSNDRLDKKSYKNDWLYKLLVDDGDGNSGLPVGEGEPLESGDIFLDETGSMDSTPSKSKQTDQDTEASSNFGLFSSKGSLAKFGKQGLASILNAVNAVLSDLDATVESSSSTTQSTVIESPKPVIIKSDTSWIRGSSGFTANGYGQDFRMINSYDDGSKKIGKLQRKELD